MDTPAPPWAAALAIEYARADSTACVLAIAVQLIMFAHSNARRERLMEIWSIALEAALLVLSIGG